MHRLFGRKGRESVLIEAQLSWYGLPYEIEEVDDLFTSKVARKQLNGSIRWRSCRLFSCLMGP